VNVRRRALELGSSVLPDTHRRLALDAGIDDDPRLIIWRPSQLGEVRENVHRTHSASMVKHGCLGNEGICRASLIEGRRRCIQILQPVTRSALDRSGVKVD
jgi:hypothetical protein